MERRLTARVRVDLRDVVRDIRDLGVAVGVSPITAEVRRSPPGSLAPPPPLKYREGVCSVNHVGTPPQ
jgi:hypothetical protein